MSMKLYKKMVKNNQTNLTVVIFISFSLFLIQYLLNGGWQNHPDSFDYIQGISAVLNGYEWFDKAVALRPGVVYLALPFTLILDNESSIGFQNFLIYLAMGPLMFVYSQKIFREDVFSFYSALLLIGSFPILYWGLSILNDLGSWFFFLLSAYLIITIFEHNSNIK